jgi:hypothetical protein
VLADLPADVVESMPSYLWAGVVVLVLLAVLCVGWWGMFPCVRTPGGHRRFRESEVRAWLEGEGSL